MRKSSKKESEKQTTRPRGKVGQPSKYDSTRIKIICRYVSRGMPEIEAAVLAGISHQTHKTWKKNQPEYLEQIRKAKAKALKAYLGVIQAAAKGGTEYETQEIVKRGKDGSITKTTIKKKQARTGTRRRGGCLASSWKTSERTA